MTHPNISLRALNTPPSPIRKLAHLAGAAKERGTKVFHLNIGQPDLESPPQFLHSVQAFHKKVVAYEDSWGNAGLREHWSSFFNKTAGVDTKPADFLVTTGASEALIFVFMVICDPGDEVIVFDPTYANYMGFAAITGVNLKPVVCKLKDNFALPPRQVIERKITSRTRAILLCNPNNPTGTVYPQETLKMLVSLANEYRLFLVVDETYREIVFDGLKPQSILAIAPKNQRLIVVDSLSKRFSLCGARIGCMISKNEEVMAAALSIAQARLAAPTIEQVAAAALLAKAPVKYSEATKDEYERRRDVLIAALQKVRGIEVLKPQGAFYCLAQLPVRDAEHFAAYMLNDFSYKGATTFVAPAEGFYVSSGLGQSEVRIAYVLDAPHIKEAVRVLEKGLEAYRN